MQDFLLINVSHVKDIILSFEGRLWIHAASKVPDEATIKAMEDFYREIYAVNGITDVQFPQHYPVSRLLGTQFDNCVNTSPMVYFIEFSLFISRQQSVLQSEEGK